MRVFTHLNWRSWSTPAVDTDYYGRGDWTITLRIGPWMAWVSA